MRILVFTLEFPPAVGGAQTVSYQLSRHLAQRGVDIHVLALGSPEADAFDRRQDFPIARIQVSPTENTIGKLGQKLNLWRDLKNAIQDFHPDAVLCGHWDPCAYIARGVLAASRKPVPYFLVAHGMELMQLPAFRPSRWLKARLRSFALQGARAVFAVSEFTRQRTIELGVAAKLVRVIPNGVDDAPDIPAPEQEPADRASRVLLTLSRLVPRKGHAVVLRALRQVSERIPGVIYEIVGTGPERERLEQLTRELQLESRVRFHGQVSEDEKRRFLNECDLFVLPCRATPTDFEGFGLVFLEAMQYGKPVIGGLSGGVPEVIRDGETGLLVQPDDPDELARAIVSILESRVKARELGENGRRNVREKYQWDRIAKTYLAEMKNQISGRVTR
jgi:phosphatidylinositol alpha-1,6-mannosyltransferase